MRLPRVVIVGAGPAGASCALTLVSRAAAEVVLVDGCDFPRIKACGGGLSPLALGELERLGVRDRFASNHADIRTLQLRGPRGSRVRLPAGTGAWVVPRSGLDHAVILAATAAGAEFRPRTTVSAIMRDSGQACGVRSGRQELEADLVVCANGAHSRFSGDPSPRAEIRTIMGWWRGASLPRDEAIMVWDRRLFGYYAWAFPEPDGVVNLGLTIPSGAPRARRLRELFAELLADHFGDTLRDADALGKWIGHPAVCTTRIGPVSESHALWVGEAARLVSPGTVEGIGFALQSGRLAADAIASHFTVGSGLSRWGRSRYRAEIGARMLPKFWAGAAYVGIMRQQRARDVARRVVAGAGRPFVERSLSVLVGDPPRARLRGA